MSVRQFEEERQQRERKLKEEIERLQTKNGELNVFLQQRTTDGWGENVVDVAMSHIQKLEHENKRLRETLEFYANKRNHEVKWYDIPSAVGFDFGETARQALKGNNNDTT